MATIDKKRSSSDILFLALIGLVLLGGIGVIAWLATSRTSLLETETPGNITLSNEVKLPLFETGNEADPAVGSEFPEITGRNFEGETSEIKADGRPKVIYFLAHWCAVCQTEVVALQKLIDDGKVPDGLDLYSVTSLTYYEGGPHRRNNFPPSAWLETVGWTPPVVVDSTESELWEAAGGSGTPFIVALDGNNNVIARSAGALPDESTIALWQQVANTPTTDSDSDESDDSTDNTGESGEASDESDG